jgi:hypothetical protein
MVADVREELAVQKGFVAMEAAILLAGAGIAAPIDVIRNENCA